MSEEERKKIADLRREIAALTAHAEVQESRIRELVVAARVQAT